MRATMVKVANAPPCKLTFSKICLRLLLIDNFSITPKLQVQLVHRTFVLCTDRNECHAIITTIVVGTLFVFLLLPSPPSPYHRSLLVSRLPPGVRFHIYTMLPICKQSYRDCYHPNGLARPINLSGLSRTERPSFPTTDESSKIKSNEAPSSNQNRKKSEGGPLVRSYRIRCVITENDFYDDLYRYFHPKVLLNGTEFTRIESY